jgi:hypothetical protein
MFMSHHLVLINFPYDYECLDPLLELEGELERALAEHPVGELDGDDVGLNPAGQPDATIYLYGPDADALYTVVLPVLYASPLTQSCQVTRTYGPPGDSTEEKTTYLPEGNHN